MQNKIGGKQLGRGGGGRVRGVERSRREGNLGGISLCVNSFPYNYLNYFKKICTISMNKNNYATHCCDVNITYDLTKIEIMQKFIYL